MNLEALEQLLKLTQEFPLTNGELLVREARLSRSLEENAVDLIAAAKRAEALKTENDRLRRKNTTLRSIAKNERRLRKLLQRAYAVCIHYANTTTAPYAKLLATELCEEIQEALK